MAGKHEHPGTCVSSFLGRLLEHCTLTAQAGPRLIMFSLTFHLRQLMSELASVMNSLPYLAASCERMANSSGKSCAPHSTLHWSTFQMPPFAG